ncbi:transposase [Bradyrhizobium elkanii]|uniref:transposase n=1 Tax=Bradyrhizobium elkanii TaxID=29448 RepID=UPI001BA600B1|nr:transposase [Bradyrhizobium elkanii]MBR1165234.1 IS110 family transposase [Bradyrhizobium elkanii]
MLKPTLQNIFAPLLVAKSCLTEQSRSLDRQLLAVAKRPPNRSANDDLSRYRSPDAVSFVATIDDPTRCRHYADVGANLGLTPKPRYQSGEIDRVGHISKRGDHQMRTYLFEAANVLLTVVGEVLRSNAGAASWPNTSALKKAKIAVARIMTAILHASWTDGLEFQAEMRSMNQS